MSDAAAPGFLHLELDPAGAERLVLRFPTADLSAASSENGLIRLDLELRGSAEALAGWNPSLRRLSGLIVLGETEGEVEVSELKLRLPSSIRDLEVHTRSGDIDVAAGRVGLLLETESGRVRASGAQTIEALSHAGDIEIEDSAHAELRSGAGRIFCVRIADRLISKSGSGDIIAEDCGADLALETKSGEVSVARPRGRVMVQTHSGDVELEVSGPFGGGDIATVSGHISLGLDCADLELRAETLSGRLVGPEGEIGSPAGPRRVALSLGKGGRRLHAKSVSGDIEISD